MTPSSSSFLIITAPAVDVVGDFSIATIFLFAGPHNLMEFRYFAARMPVRWGRSRLYYSVGIGGVVRRSGFRGCGRGNVTADSRH